MGLSLNDKPKSEVKKEDTNKLRPQTTKPGSKRPEMSGVKKPEQKPEDTITPPKKTEPQVSTEPKKKNKLDSLF
jgi:hypothetical protein